MKLFTTFAAIALTATSAFATGSNNGGGSFDGDVSSFSEASGGSVTVGHAFNGNGTSSISNESGAQNFSGSAVTYSIDGGNEGGINMTAETFVNGSDFSSTTVENWGDVTGGAGGSFGIRHGEASADGNYSGQFGDVSQNGGGCQFFCF